MKWRDDELMDNMVGGGGGEGERERMRGGGGGGGGGERENEGRRGGAEYGRLVEKNGGGDYFKDTDNYTPTYSCFSIQ